MRQERKIQVLTKTDYTGLITKKQKEIKNKRNKLKVYYQQQIQRFVHPQRRQQKRKENIHIICEIAFLFFSVGIIQVVILAFIQMHGIPYFIPLSMFGLFSLYKLSRFIWLSNNDGYSAHMYSIIEHLLSFCSIAAVVMYFEYKEYYFSYICIPLFISTALKLESSKFQKRLQKDLTFFYNITGFVVSAFVWIQILQIGLKLDVVIELSWEELLWPFWTSLVILAVISVVFLLYAISSARAYFKQTTTSKLFYGYFSLFFIFSVFVISLFLTSIRVLEYLNEEEIQNDAISYALIFCLVQLTVSSIMIYRLVITIEESLVNLLLIDTRNQNASIDVVRALQNILRHQRIDQTKISKKIEFEIKKFQISTQDQMYLVKFKLNKKQNINQNIIKQQKQSATFFQIIQNSNDKKNKLQQEQSPVVSEGDKKYRRIRRKSHSFSQFGEEQKLSQFDSDNSPNNLIQSEQSDNGGNKIQHNGEKSEMNDINSKMPLQYLRSKDEIITTEICRKQQEQDNILDIHDIITEISPRFKRFESACFIQDNPKNVSYCVKNKLEESKDMSVQTCLVCFDKTPDSVFIDCGHGGICYDCAIQMWNKTSECYLCRKGITQVLQTDCQTKNEDKKLMKVISKTLKVQKQQ